jgi:hypothetical protein
MLKIMGIALVSGLILGCSGNSSSTRTVDEEVITNLGGRIGASTTGARVTAVAINAEGSPVRIFDDAGNKVFDGSYDISNDAGDFEVILDAELVGRSMMFIATNDSGNVGYRCESVGGCSGVSYEGYVSIPEDLDIRAGVGEVADSMTVNVNWLTDLASSLAKTVYIDALENDLSSDDRADIDAAVLADIDTAETGVYNEYTIELANLHISKMFGLSDVIFVKPIGPSQITKDQNLSSTQLQESIYMGALVGALPLIAKDKSDSYTDALTDITEVLRRRKGQLLQKDSDGSSGEVTLADIYSHAVVLLEENINYLKNEGARLPPEADSALSKLKTVLNSLKDGEETNVVVDVPAELAGWTTNIGKSKEFIADLTEAIKNFWGEDPSQSSFVDPAHGRRLDAYFAAHESLYADVAPGMFAAFNDILLAANYLSVCENGGSCTPGGGFEINESESKVTIGGSLVITLTPVGESAPYTEFDIDISDGSLTKTTGTISTTYTWSKGFISDFSREEQPYIRLVFEDKSSTIPDLNNIEPTQITVVWPSVRFTGTLTDSGADNGDHAIDLLFETNLYAVNDPLNPSAEIRYNPGSLVFWVRSASGDGSFFDLTPETLENASPINNTAFQSELLTSFSLQYYPSQKWPTSSEFFKSRSDSPVTIPNMVSLYVGKETLDNGTVVDVFDQELIGESSLIRIRIYPYDVATDSTSSQGCIVDSLGGEASQCSAVTLLAGERTLSSLLEANFKEGILSTYAVKANGEYTIDLNQGGGNIIVDGEFNAMPAGTYGPYEGTFLQSFQLGIEKLYVATNSQMVKDGEYVPVALEAALQRSTNDIYSASLAYAYASQYDLADIEIPVGQEAQGFVLEYEVSVEDSIDENGDFFTNEIELGNVIIYRTGVVLSGSEETVGASLVSRVEYQEGDDKFGCGVNDRDKLSSAEGCDAVAFLTFRGALVATIREERPNVFVARFVDGSWMVLGE